MEKYARLHCDNQSAWIDLRKTVNKYRGASRSFVRSFVRYCGQGSSLLWTPALRPSCRSNAPAQGEEGNC